MLNFIIKLIFKSNNKMSNIFVVSAPSGAGKSSLVNAVCEIDSNIKLSISHTTRSQRSGEVDGVDYHFTDVSTFQQMINNNEFIEYAKVYDNYYGTNKNTISNFIQQGYKVILEIDHQGALQIKKLIPEAVLIYIKPPSISELERRLRGRNTDNEETITKRLSQANLDMSYAKYFDKIIINDDFIITVKKIHKIIID